MSTLTARLYILWIPSPSRLSAQLWTVCVRKRSVLGRPPLMPLLPFGGKRKMLPTAVISSAPSFPTLWPTCFSPPLKASALLSIKTTLDKRSATGEHHYVPPFTISSTTFAPTQSHSHAQHLNPTTHGESPMPRTAPPGPPFPNLAAIHPPPPLPATVSRRNDTSKRNK